MPFRNIQFRFQTQDSVLDSGRRRRPGHLAGTPALSSRARPRLGCRAPGRHPAHCRAPCHPYARRRSGAKEQDAGSRTPPQTPSAPPGALRRPRSGDATATLQPKGKGPAPSACSESCLRGGCASRPRPPGPGRSRSRRREDNDERPARVGRGWGGGTARGGARGGRGGPRRIKMAMSLIQACRSLALSTWLLSFVLCIWSAWTSPWPRRRNGTQPS